MAELTEAAEVDKQAEAKADNMAEMAERGVLQVEMELRSAIFLRNCFLLL